MPSERRLLSAAEAATRLGVKRETLYAYVSRGLLTSERREGGRASLFDAGEVEALAERTRRGGRSGGLELVVASGLTLIENDHLHYRGLDVEDLVPETPFEAVAEWLWTATPIPAPGSPPPVWPPADLPPADLAPASVPAWVRPLDRLRIQVALASTSDHLRSDLTPAGVAAAGRRLISAMVDGFPAQPRHGQVTPAPPPSSAATPFPLAARLAPKLGPHVAPELVGIVNTILVLLADHELAASTLATRVAASVRADPYSVVSTGLGVIAGPLHGAASQPVVGMLEEIGTPERVALVVGERLGRQERIAGLGHKVYRTTDPRAEVVLDLLRRQQLPPGRLEVIEPLLALVRERLPLVVNIDFALGALIWAFDLDTTSGETLFAIARTAGWLAHAVEEYAERPVRFRPRAAYTGPRRS